MRKQEPAMVPSVSADLCPANKCTNEVLNENIINYSSVPLQITTHNDFFLNEKAITFSKYFLLYDSWILTNKCISTNMRHNISIKNAVLQHLVNQNFLCEIKGGLKSYNGRVTVVDIWVKCMPSRADDFALIQEWESRLSMYKVTWDEYSSTLSNIRLNHRLFMADSLNKYIITNYSIISTFIEVNLS